MNPRFFPLFFLLLSATFSGCLSPAARSGAPAGEGGEASVSSHETASDAGSGTGSTGGSTTSPVIADGGGILPARPDGERLGGETAFAALYGPDFSQTLSSDQSGGITLPRDGRVDVALRMQRNTVDVQPGLQVRLIVTYTDAYGKLRYRHCDALTSAVKPEGFNVSFTGVDVSSGGQLHVFVVNPAHPGRVPTADFSASCENFPDETTNNTSFIADLILAEDFLFVGTFQLMIYLEDPSLTEPSFPHIL